MNNLSSYGKEIRSLRLKRNMNLVEFSNLLKKKSSYLSSMERGKRPIPLKLIKNIINILDLNDEEIKRLYHSIDNCITSIDFNHVKNSRNKILLCSLTRKIDNFNKEDIDSIDNIIKKYN